MINNKSICAVIPCFNARDHILNVVKNMPPWVDSIIIVDDHCPAGTGECVREYCPDARITIIRHDKNQGVGGACLTGFNAAKKQGHDIIIKMDGDDQMDPSYITRLLNPLIEGIADYAKGNRFYHINALKSMPVNRRIGNLGLTLLTKFSSGFWHISDPTNGFVALHSSILDILSPERLSKRYFFETSLLIQLNIIGATVCDVPIPARYGNEKSSLKIRKVLLEFPFRLMLGLIKRIVWKYFIYNVNGSTVLFTLGTMLTAAGGWFGAYKWIKGYENSQFQSAGTVALALLPVIVGIQMLLQAMLLDIVDKPAIPLHRVIKDK